MSLRVFIFTYKSPFSQVPEFVENEVAYWPDEVPVYLLSLADRTKQKIENFNGYRNINAQSVSPISLKLILKIIWYSFNFNFFRAIVQSFFKKPIRNIISRIYALIQFEFVKHRYRFGLNELLNEISDKDKILLYSYWLGPASLAAIEFKKKFNDKNIWVVSRAHGSDIYSYSHENNYIPYIKLNINKIDSLFCISHHGREYIQNKFHIKSNNIEISHLGIPDHNSSLKISVKSKDYFHIVSCSYLSSVKRVHYIIEALENLETSKQILWTHLGGGPLQEEITNLIQLKLSKKTNITTNITGNVSNQIIIDFYKQNNANLLVNVSLSEGIPVSMMEAASFGVPLVGPKIGGIEEIIIENYNGFLLDRNSVITELAFRIDYIMNLTDWQYNQMCLNSRKVFIEKFSANNNYPNFINTLINKIG